MPAFDFVAVDEKGVEKRGVLEVANRVQALERIREMGLAPTLVMAANRPPPESKAKPARVQRNFERFPRLLGRVRTADVALFTRQLAIMLEAGVPLLRCFRALQKQQRDPKFKRVIRNLAFAVETGYSFTEALAAHPKTFSKLYINIARAGEAGGTLAGTLRRSAEFMEKAEKLKRKVKGAMLYPAMVVVVAILVLTLLMTVALPRIKEVLEGLITVPLPPFTRFVFGISDALAHRVGVIALLLGAAWFCVALLLRTKAGRWVFDYFKLVMPVLGPLFQKVAISRFTRTLGTLLGNGVPMLQALTLSKESVGNAVLAGLIAEMHTNAKQGEPLAPTLQHSALIPGLVADMVNVGEESGALPDMLTQIAEAYDDEVETTARAITSLIEPILIVLLAVIVGSIVIAMFLPLLSLLNANLLSPGARGTEQ